MENTQRIEKHTRRVSSLPAPDVIRARVAQFVRRNYRREIKDLHQPWRQCVAWVLSTKCAFTITDIALMLGVSERTAREDVGRMELFYFRGSNLRTHADKIFDYIIYNARYLP